MAATRAGRSRGPTIGGPCTIAPRPTSTGRPWSERKRLVWWDERQAQWIGNDTPDFVPTKPPGMRPDWSKQPRGMDALGGDDPFIMEADGKCLAVRAVRPEGWTAADAITNRWKARCGTRCIVSRANPAAKLWVRPGNELHEPQDPRFPYVFTTYRLTELHCGGISTRVMPHTAELQPEAFVEMSPELAEELDIANLDWTVLSTARGAVEVKALVTERMRPFTINGELVHQVGMPWVFGWEGYAHGAIANVLLAIFGDPNTSIHTTKAVTCALRKGRLPQPEPAELG